MSKLLWGQSPNKTYEYGVDRGVLYLPDLQGNYVEAHAWDGLTAVEERSTGGDSISAYQDGIKFNQRNLPGDYEGKLTAFTYPDAFQKYQGYADVGFGVFAADQVVNDYFGLSYRTWVGESTRGQRYGYKIHLLYNLTAVAEDTTYNTMGDKMDAMDFSWALSGVPVSYTGIRPTCHFVLDTTKSDTTFVSNVEKILYGSDDVQPRLPSISELYSFLPDRITDVIIEPV